MKPLALESKNLQVLWLKFFDGDVGKSLTTPSSLFISLAVFNSLSFTKEVRKMHDVCHCQGKSFLSIKRHCSDRSFSASQWRTGLPAQCCFYCSTWTFLPVFNIAPKCCLWKDENSGRFIAALFLVPHSLNRCLHPFRVSFFLSSHL